MIYIFLRKDFFIIVFSLLVLNVNIAHGKETILLFQSVEKALQYNPQIKVLPYTRKAAERDLKQARSGYFPSLDLTAGYGPSQYSDITTRSTDADPSDKDWQLKTNASVKLTQMIFDGGETSSSVSIEKTALATVDLAREKTTQNTILLAINAHLDLVRQQQLVTLAKQNLQIHEDIYKALTDFSKAGVGDIADVSQTKTRISWVKSNLAENLASLDKSRSQYERVIGEAPDQISFSDIPVNMPGSLEEALATMELHNPVFLASTQKINEAKAKLSSARSNYYPKINIELSSSYYDHVEGEKSWRQDNDALVTLNWNLFSGGGDRDAIKAARARVTASHLDRDDTRATLRNTMKSAWISHQTLQQQKKLYHEAVTSSRETFEIYAKQFTVSKRSLLDVLNAEREFFQLSQKLISTKIDEVISAYELLELEGVLNMDQLPRKQQQPSDFSEMLKALTFPAIDWMLFPTQSASNISNIIEQ